MKATGFRIPSMIPSVKPPPSSRTNRNFKPRLTRAFGDPSVSLAAADLYVVPQREIDVASRLESIGPGAAQLLQAIRWHRISRRGHPVPRYTRPRCFPRTAGRSRLLSVPDSVGTTSMCDISRIGGYRGVGALPAVEEAEVAVDLAVEGQRGPGGKTSAETHGTPERLNATVASLGRDRAESERSGQTLREARKRLDNVNLVDLQAAADAECRWRSRATAPVRHRQTPQRASHRSASDAISRTRRALSALHVIHGRLSRELAMAIGTRRGRVCGSQGASAPWQLVARLIGCISARPGGAFLDDSSCTRDP